MLDLQLPPGATAIADASGLKLEWIKTRDQLNEAEAENILKATRIHHRLAQIHPFHNGNGRHARLIGDLYLFSLRGEKPIWPERDLSNDSRVRDEYISSLKNADAGDYSFLIGLIEKHGGRQPRG